MIGDEARPRAWLGRMAPGTLGGRFKGATPAAAPRIALPDSPAAGYRHAQEFGWLGTVSGAMAIDVLVDGFVVTTLNVGVGPDSDRDDTLSEAVAGWWPADAVPGQVTVDVDGEVSEPYEPLFDCSLVKARAVVSPANKLTVAVAFD